MAKKERISHNPPSDGIDQPDRGNSGSKQGGRKDPIHEPFEPDKQPPEGNNIGSHLECFNPQDIYDISKIVQITAQSTSNTITQAGIPVPEADMNTILLEGITQPSHYPYLLEKIQNYDINNRLEEIDNKILPIIQQSSQDLDDLSEIVKEGKADPNKLITFFGRLLTKHNEQLESINSRLNQITDIIPWINDLLEYDKKGRQLLSQLYEFSLKSSEENRRMVFFLYCVENMQSAIPLITNIEFHHKEKERITAKLFKKSDGAKIDEVKIEILCPKCGKSNWIIIWSDPNKSFWDKFRQILKIITQVALCVVSFLFMITSLYKLTVDLFRDIGVGDDTLESFKNLIDQLHEKTGDVKDGKDELSEFYEKTQKFKKEGEFPWTEELKSTKRDPTPEELIFALNNIKLASLRAIPGPDAKKQQQLMQDTIDSKLLEKYERHQCGFYVHKVCESNPRFIAIFDLNENYLKKDKETK